MPHYTADDEINNDHGRIESRKCIVVPILAFMIIKPKWKGLKA